MSMTMYMYTVHRTRSESGVTWPLASAPTPPFGKFFLSFMLYYQLSEPDISHPNDFLLQNFPIWPRTIRPLRVPYNVQRS